MDEFVLVMSNLIKDFDKEYKLEIWNTANEIIDALIHKVAINWERKIDAEHQKSYVTDEVENKFKRFTTNCMRTIMKYPDIILNKNISLEKLFSHRHFGYGFYMSYEDQNQNNDLEVYDEILNDILYNKTLYMSLVEYFYNFYGSFYDNEMAIRMICRYFSEKVNFSLNDNELIVKSLYSHIQNAGAPGDTGYAFNGISLITQYINRLPENIVLKLLAQYKFYQIINNKIYRNQLYTIIKYMNSQNNKKEYKFFFIDSVLILNIFQSSVFKREDWDSFAWDRHGNMDHEIKILNHLKKNEDYNLIYDLFNSRKIKSLNHTLLSITFADEKIKVKYLNKIMKTNLNFDDWILNYYESSEFCDELKKIFSGCEIAKNTKLIGTSLNYSYVYLNNYRGLKHQSLSFDNRYIYNYQNKEIQSNNSISLSIPYFYGKKIYSLSCIVGKNGSGKTSIVDFLSNEFFKVLYLFDTSTAWEGKDSHEDIIQKLLVDAGLNKTTEVLVVITVNNLSYLITNITEIKDITNSINMYGMPNRSISSANSKLIYFSNKIDLNYLDPQNKLNMRTSDEMKSLQNYGLVDYSAMKSLAMADVFAIDKRIDDMLNKDFCYQLYFLKYHRNSDLEKMLWKGFKKESLKISNIKFNDVFTKVITNSESDSQILSKEEQLQFKDMLSHDRIKIQHFSSGEYAKFLFLSKLFWCLVGFSAYSDEIKEITEVDVFDANETIRQNDSVIIFIDEGEVYYHPEWQRTYINTLLEMINNSSINANIQIILTTNSPFILSDIIGEDVTYLSENISRQLTFGQNIHTLLKHNFFMKSTIGEFAKEVIEFIILELTGLKDSNFNEISEHVNSRFNTNTNEEDVYDYLHNVIDSIGEEIYRNKLLDMLDRSFKKTGISQIDELRKKKAQLEEQIKTLEEGINNNDIHGNI